MPSETGRFRRSDRILRSREFRQVLARGRRVASRSFVVFVDAGDRSDAQRAGGGAIRLGITVSRKVGNAVVRNRVKRRIREWFRTARASLPLESGSEVVVIARRSAADLGWRPLCEELSCAVARGTA